MSSSPLINAIQDRLRAAGYLDIATPFRIASVEFSFTGAMRGRDGRALDLVLLFDTTTGDFGDRDAARVRQRVEALSRALDVTGSRYVVTAILAGAVLSGSVEALADVCRVLQIETVALDAQGLPADEAAVRQIEDQIRVLLPLTIPDAHIADGGGPAMDQLQALLPSNVDRSMVAALIAAAGKSEDAVTKAASVAVRAPLTVIEKREPGL